MTETLGARRFGNARPVFGYPGAVYKHRLRSVHRSWALCLGLACWSVGCGDSGTSDPPVEELCPLAIRIAGQGIDEYTVTLEIPAPTLGVQLSAKPAAGGLAVPANLVTWSTQDTSIAKVSATGYLTGVARGTTWVSATCGSARAGIGVEVQQFVRYFEKVSGDGQAALVGTKLPLPLVARVKDFAGNPMAGVDVVWSPGSGHVSV